MAYAIVYGIHTLEMSALRGWGVAYLAFVATATGTSAAALSPAAALTVLGLAGTVASILGNEAAMLLGRRRLIASALIASMVCACLLGLVGPSPHLPAASLLLLYGPIVVPDSSLVDRRHGRNRGAIAAGRDARRAFDARLHRRLRRSAHRRLDLGCGRRHGAAGLGRRLLRHRAAFGDRVDLVRGHAPKRAGG